MSIAVPFPDVQPTGYEWRADEPTFDSALHLQLEMPSELKTLTDLGYSAGDIEGRATPFAVSAPE